MFDFSAEDLFDAVDRLVADALRRHGTAGPPVDAVRLAQDAFDLTVREAEDEDEVRVGRFGPRPPRRGNRTPETKKLTAAEQAALAKLGRYEEPRQTVRTDGWTATAWPVPGGPFNRIIVRSVPDDL